MIRTDGSRDALQVRPAGPDDRLPIARMLELYQHDLSDVWDQDLDSHGEFGYALDRYWRSPACKPFVFKVMDRFAGFALVDDSVRLVGNQLWMAQFFVMKKYRRSGVGGAAAGQVFDQVRGRWEVGQMPLNLPAQAFWHHVIAGYTGGRFVEHVLNDERWHGALQCFDNSLPAG
jgi:predicted acetyltransferase